MGRVSRYSSREINQWLPLFYFKNVYISSIGFRFRCLSAYLCKMTRYGMWNEDKILELAESVQGKALEYLRRSCLQECQKTYRGCCITIGWLQSNTCRIQIHWLQQAWTVVWTCLILRSAKRNGQERSMQMVYTHVTTAGASLPRMSSI